MVMALAACGEREAPVARAQFPAPRTDAVQVGGENVTSPDAAIGRVVAARFTQSGEHIVVLDFAPPYVKVFRRNGTLDTAFLAAGGGPLEMRYPVSLAVAGDSAILVADGTRRVAVFGMDGQLRGEGRTKFPVLAAVAGCDGGWLAYGPSRTAGESPSWLHRLHVGTGTAQVVDVDFRDALGEGVIGHGLSYGIARSGDSVRVWHVLTKKPSVLGVACGQNRPEVRAVAPLARRSAKQERQKSGVRMSVHPGLRTLAGMAAVPGGVVLAAQVIPEPGDSATTELTLVTADGERTVSVPGSYTLRDSHPRLGVLVSVTDPVPQLFTISSDELRRLFDGP
jgi:hypothetical protein